MTDQGNNFLDLSQALNAFYNATIELGLQNKITTFTLSDFGRTLQPSGSGGSIGTDHGWGSHHLVMGDAVNGGNFYGTPNGTTGSIFPTLQPGGPDDTTNSSEQRPRPLDPDERAPTSTARRSPSGSAWPTSTWARSSRTRTTSRPWTSGSWAPLRRGC